MIRKLSLTALVVQAGRSGFIIRNLLSNLILINVGHTMLLVHIYIAEHKALKNINIPISGSFKCEFVQGEMRLGRKSDSSAYYGGYHCSALIGPNGVGKSSILEVAELLTARTDSRAFVIFHKESFGFYICGINMDEGDVDSLQVDGLYNFVVDNSLFLKRNKLNWVKVNNLPADDGLLTLSTRKPVGYVRELTVRENVKSSKRRKRYFEKLLNYFSEGHFHDEFMEEVAFAFEFSSSPVSVLQSALGHRPLDVASNAELVKEWCRERTPLVEFGYELSSSLLFQSLLAINILSILSALADSSGIAKKIILPFFLLKIAEIDLENNDGMACHNRLRYMMRRIQDDEAICSEISRLADLSIADLSVAMGEVEKELEDYISIFDKVAETIYDHCFDGEQFELSRVVTTDYLTIENLTGLISAFPSNIASNIRWGWRGVSTGELARVHIFSEIYAFLKKEGRGNNIIVIDEADLYLHPEWQRTFLHDLLQHLSNMKAYENISSPQIIVCTHSPIIISDFLPENILSLCKNNYGETEVAESYGFGNSIGDIYMNGMHLKSTFGEHAKKTLDGIISRGRQGVLTEADYRLVDKIPNSHVKNFLLSHD